MLEGLDVSGFQPTTIDWGKVAASGVSFVIVKATDGLGSPDPHFAAHVAGASAAGLRCGAYHYLHPRHGKPQDAAAQADEFADRYLGAGCELVPAVDCEDTGNEGVTPAEWLEAIRACTAQLEVRVGCKPMLYSYPAFWASLGPTLAGATDLAACMLWWAQYGVSAPHTPAPWAPKLPAVWQYTDKGVVPGVPGHVDRSCSWLELPDLVRPNSAAAALQTMRDERSVTGPLAGDDEPTPGAA